MAQQQLSNLLQSQQPIQATAQLSFHNEINGVPTATWAQQEKPVITAACAEKRFNGLAGNELINGTAPGGPNAPGGPPGNAVITVYQSASASMYGLLMGKVDKNCSLYYELCAAPYLNDAFLTWSYICYKMTQTTNLDSARQIFIATWDKALMSNSVKLTEDAVYKWKDYLVKLNQVPAAYSKTRDEVTKKLCDGMVKELSSKAIDLYDDNAVAMRIPAVYPANIYPGGPAHPNAGAAMVGAGQRDVELYAQALHFRFKHLIELGAIHLQTVDVNAAQDFDDGSGVWYEDPFEGAFHVEEDFLLTEGIYSMMDQGYTVAEIQHLNRVSKFPRCYNCGGLNHFAKKDGQHVCPTPEGSVPKQVLFGIQYPVGVLGGGKGRGKGKGKGKGKGYGRGGRGGSGGYGYRTNETINALLHTQPASTVPPATNSPAPAPAPAPPPPTVAGAMASPQTDALNAAANAEQLHAADEFDVEDLYSVTIDD